MRVVFSAVAGVAWLSLTGCGGTGDDKLGEQAQKEMENRAEEMDAAAENMSGAAKDSLEANADATREQGQLKREALDDADVDADALSNAEKDAVIRGD